MVSKVSNNLKALCFHPDIGIDEHALLMSVWQSGIYLEEACAKAVLKYGVANSSPLFHNCFIVYYYEVSSCCWCSISQKLRYTKLMSDEKILPIKQS